MNRQKNLFYRVATQNENTVTELLTNMMGRKYIRDVLLRKFKIPIDTVKNIKYENISTQVSILNNKRPDIIIENNELIVFIENKINTYTQLQNSQVTIYYQDLIERSKKIKIMLFLVPRNYEHMSEIHNAKKEYTDKSIQTEILYWDEVVNELFENDINESDSSIRDAITYIVETVGLNSIKKTFSKGEIIYMYDSHTLKYVNTLFLKTKKYTDEVANKVFRKHKDNFKMGKCTFEMNDRNIGTWITPTDDRQWLLFIGYNFSMDDEAFLVQLRIHDTLIKVKPEIESTSITHKDEWYIFALPKSIMSNEENVPLKLYIFVEEVIEKYC